SETGRPSPRSFLPTRHATDPGFRGDKPHGEREVEVPNGFDANRNAVRVNVQQDAVPIVKGRERAGLSRDDAPAHEQCTGRCFVRFAECRLAHHSPPTDTAPEAGASWAVAWNASNVSRPDRHSSGVSSTPCLSTRCRR